MRHPSLNITDEQEANLRKLAAYLLTKAKPEQFGMRNYMSYENCWCKAKEITSCGTVACAAGHGPTAGIAPLEGEDWEDYVIRAFFGTEQVEWKWCFASGWASADNTPTGAGKRILYMLEFGVPDQFGFGSKYEDLAYVNWTPGEVAAQAKDQP